MKLKNLNQSNKITILFLSWRDIKSPKKGGAEVYTHEMLKRVDKNKYRIIHFSPIYDDLKESEVIDDITYLRAGNKISVINKAKEFYKKNSEYIDFVVDQCNTHRFFTKFWVEPKKRIFFIHQLTREIWFRHMFQPLSTLGYITESPFLKLSKKDPVITVSNSTKSDLISLGFKENNITILPEGIDFEHWKKEDFLKKEISPTFIYVGRYAKYKGIDDVVESFGLIKNKYPDAKLWLVGKKNQEYLDNTLIPLFNKHFLSHGEFSDANIDVDVTIFGFVSDEKKLELMSKATCLLFPSLREGWGLIITEAAAVGTPSIVYNSPGTRDAVDFGNAGYMCERNNVENLLKNMVSVIQNKSEYQKKRDLAYDFSLKFHWNNTAKEFELFMDELLKNN